MTTAPTGSSPGPADLDDLVHQDLVAPGTPQPCVARPHAGLVHREGACRCFVGGPPPEHAARPEDALLGLAFHGAA